MQRWKLTYVIDGGGPTFGTESLPSRTHEVEIDADGLDDEQILAKLHAEIHEHTDGQGVLTGAEEVTDAGKAT